MTKIQKNQICFPSCSSWPNDRNWPKNTQKKLRKTKQQIITLIRIKTYWDFSGFQGANYQQCHGVVSRRKHQLVPKASCDDPKPSPSFCLPIVATVAGVAHISFGCHTTSTVGVLYLFVCRSAAKGSLRKIKVISTTQKVFKFYI